MLNTNGHGLWSMEEQTQRRCVEYLQGTISEPEEFVLRKAVSSGTWLHLLETRIKTEEAKIAQSAAEAKAKLIADCLRPLGGGQGTHELAMRQLRLLAAILERLK